MAPRGLNGLVSIKEMITPVSGNTAIAIKNLGLTEIEGGLTLAALSGSILKDGDAIGQLKIIECLGTLTTNGFRVTLETAGVQMNGTTALVSITFDAANEVAILEWTGFKWRLVDSSGCTLAAT